MKDANAAVSFAPIASPSARILILGSLPGVKSLEANQYYAHPRNAFWRIMADIYRFDATAPYEIRVESLMAAGIAVWDVLQFCVRPGSLDSSIDKRSQVPNDFRSFFLAHANIGSVFFNGAAAEAAFRSFGLHALGVRDISFRRLPSSSPAHAVAYGEKALAWRKELDALNSG
jgi:TDG/mug DNA glycosylase family protein